MMICFITGQVIARGSGLPGTGIPNRLVSISSLITVQGNYGQYWACNNPNSRTIHTVTGNHGEFVLPFCIADGTEHEWLGGRFSLTVHSDHLGRGPSVVARGQTNLAGDIARVLSAAGITSSDAQSAVNTSVQRYIQDMGREVVTTRGVRTSSSTGRITRSGAHRVRSVGGGRGAGIQGVGLHSARMHRPYGAIKIIV